MNALRRIGLVAAFVAALLVVSSPLNAQQEDPVCDEASSGLDPAPNVGRIFQTGVKQNFEDSDPHDHVPDGWSASSNYSPSPPDCDRRIVDNDNADNNTDVLEQEIFTTSDSNKRSGDVSIFRSYRARPRHQYRVTVRVDLRSTSGDFRGRLKVAPWHDNDPFAKDEQFIDLCSDGSDTSNGDCVATDDGNFQKLSFETERFPRGTNIIKIAWRARETKDQNAAGVAILDWIKYVRIK